MDRRQFLALASGAAAGLAGCTTRNRSGTTTGGPGTTAGPDPATTPPGDGPAAVGLAPLATGFTVPLDLAVDPEADRQYVAEQRGTLHLVEDGERRPSPALDLRDSVATGAEMGLLGVAFHPEFPADPRLFVRYSAPPRSDTPEGYSHTFVLSSFRVAEDGTVDPATEREVLTIPEPQANHNAGSIVFGPDDYLYVGVGDGGAGGDQGRGHVDDWYAAVPGGNGQDVTANLLGSILRIDVDRTDDDRSYGIPGDNPLVGREGLDEQFAWGFRNPWRFGFDGDSLLVGDVGQGAWEEVDVVEAGGNYGWNVLEGTHCYGADDCPDATPEAVRGGEPLRDPVVEYPHGSEGVAGISVIAGNVYRGDAVPALRGRYVFGDLAARGRLFVADPTDEGRWPTAVLPIRDADAGRLSQLFSVERHDGDLFVLGSGDGGGGVYRLVSG